MTDFSDTCLIILSAHECTEDVIYALKKSATALGYDQEPLFLSLDKIDKQREHDKSLSWIVHTVDPWFIIALDDESILALHNEFGLNNDNFYADKPANICGYNFVAVPNFADCLNDQDKKRIAWGRLKAAQHPKEAW